MQLPDVNFDDVRKMIHAIEADEGKDLSPNQLDEYQKKLDQIDRFYKHDHAYDSRRHELYELQALLHDKSGDAKLAAQFAVSALGFADDPSMMRSKRVKQLALKATTESEGTAMADAVTPNAYGQKTSDGAIVFFHKSPLTAALLSFFSLNIYNLYWAYKHWRLIRLSTGERTYPVLSAIFQVFTIYSLFKRIRNAATSHGFSAWQNAGALAAFYIVLILIGNTLARIEPKNAGDDILVVLLSLLFTGMIAAIVYTVQKAANYSNERTLGNGFKYPKYLTGEIIFSTIGILLFCVLIGVTAYNASTNTYPQGSVAEIEAQQLVMDDLTKQYEECSTDLTSRESKLDTDNADEVDTYNADWDACEAIRLKQNTAVDEYNRLGGF